MNPINVKLITCIDFGVEKDKDLKFKVGDHVQISKYKNTYLQKTTLQIGLEKVKNTVQQTYVIEDLNGEKIIGKFYKKELRIEF